MAINGPLKTSIARVWSLWQRLSGKSGRLTILYYHAVTDEYRGDFRRQMKILAEEAELVFADTDLPAKGSRPLVAVTFDDAFRSVAKNVLPITEELGIPVTIFVPTGWLGKSPGWMMETEHDRKETVMSRTELSDIGSSTVRLASHSVDHPHMSAIAASEQRRQFARSRDEVEQITGSAVDSFAFPYGDFDESCVEEGVAAGYRYLFTVQPQAIDTGSLAPLRGRTACDPSDPDELFRLKLRGAFEWMPYATRLKQGMKRIGR